MDEKTKPCPLCGTENKVARNWFDELNDWKEEHHWGCAEKQCSTCHWTHTFDRPRPYVGWSGVNKRSCMHPSIPPSKEHLFDVSPSTVCDLWETMGVSDG